MDILGTSAVDVFNIRKLYESAHLFKGATKKADNVVTDSHAGMRNMSNLAQTALD